LADIFQQREILHVAGADLNAVAVFFHRIDTGFVHRLGHDIQVKFFANVGKYL